MRIEQLENTSHRNNADFEYSTNDSNDADFSTEMTNVSRGNVRG